MRADIHKGETLKIFEREVKILGVEFSEFKYLLFEALLIIMLPSMGDLLGIDAGSLFYLFMAALMLATLIVLRRMAKHNYKNYIMDIIGFKVRQPRLIRISKQNG